MNMRTRTDVLLLVAFCGFLFFWGLGSFGLIGADEPRYAQVAHEMLERHDWITPTLAGKAWLEKPALYYWEAIVTYRAAGVAASGPADLSGATDRAARLPGAIDAALMIAVIYLFLRRFRPGSQIDGALITASCAAVIGFSRAAAMDMPLAAMFTIALLGWYGWYESEKRGYLALFYAFLALGTLAKGPVAPFLALVILVIFALLKREWRILLRTLWIPGILVFLVVALPWYVAVQFRNAEVFRVFILQHNLARFSEDLYHHRQPFWVYIPVLLLGTMPWTLWLIAAVVERFRLAWSEGRNAISSEEDSWQLFLLIWLLVPVLFFSASQSKLPGYVLPAIPAGALLVSEYLAGKRATRSGISGWLAALHGLLCGLLLFAALVTPNFLVAHRLLWTKGTYVAVVIAAIVALGIFLALLSRAGLRWLRVATMVPVVLGVAAILRLAAPLLDATLSARPIALTIESFSHEPVPVATYHTTREQEYGLEFYLDRGVQEYEMAQVPVAGHVLVASRNTEAQFTPLISGRRISRLTSVPAQNLDIFWVGPSP